VSKPFIPPDILLGAYAGGIFPMADSTSSDEIFWVDPEERGVLPLHNIHIPRRLRRTIKQEPYRVTLNRDFRGVLRACRGGGNTRPESWINDVIFYSYLRLHQSGHAHSIECWHDDELVGGLYGVSLAGAFFGESMFSTATDASKIALFYLTARLRAGGFTLLDCQFKTQHLAQFGVIDVPRGRYHSFLQDALEKFGDIDYLPEYISPSDVLQLNGQTS
jgi:leucyl/phenylalanyl-tRNA--protein transferase